MSYSDLFPKGSFTEEILKQRIAEIRLRTQQKRRDLIDDLRNSISQEESKAESNPEAVAAYKSLLKKVQSDDDEEVG